MDKQTLDWYETHGVEVTERYESVGSPLQAFFPVAFPPGCSVLDIGCGSGRDLSHLLAAGYDAYGLEPSGRMRDQAVYFHPELSGRIFAGGLPVTGLHQDKRFDGILSTASFMHVPIEHVFDAALALRQLFNKNGRLLMSVPQKRTGLDPNSRDEAGRLFTAFSPDELKLLFERLGFVLLREWVSEDSLGRTDCSWLTLLFEQTA